MVWSSAEPGQHVERCPLECATTFGRGETEDDFVEVHRTEAFDERAQDAAITPRIDSIIGHHQQRAPDRGGIPTNRRTRGGEIVISLTRDGNEFSRGEILNAAVGTPHITTKLCDP